MDMPGNVFKQLLQQRCLQIGLFVGLASAYSMEILATSMGYLGESGHAEVKPAIDDALKRAAATGKAAAYLSPILCLRSTTGIAAQASSQSAATPRGCAMPR